MPSKSEPTKAGTRAGGNAHDDGIAKTTERFPPVPEAIAQARRFVACRVPDHPRQEDMVLLVSELSTNATRHAGTPFTVEVAVAGPITRVAVSDQSPSPPVGSGSRYLHGLALLDVLADRWGVELQGTGKTVWFEMARAAAFSRTTSETGSGQAGAVPARD